jgi:hypothetical protein
MTRHRNLSHMLRDLGYDPVMVGYTASTPDPRSTPHADPRFSSRRRAKLKRQ